jgi:hypothetical protein
VVPRLLMAYRYINYRIIMTALECIHVSYNRDERMIGIL